MTNKNIYQQINFTADLEFQFDRFLGQVDHHIINGCTYDDALEMAANTKQESFFDVLDLIDTWDEPIDQDIDQMYMDSISDYSYEI